MIELVLGDITTQEVDAIVNAANPTLLGGGGVDGAIHRAGGPAILEECRGLGGCEPGDVKASGAGDPRNSCCTRLARSGAAAAKTRPAIELATELGCVSVAFPAISTGAYGYPVELAAPVAIGATEDALAAHPSVEVARFVLRDEATLATYRAANTKL